MIALHSRNGIKKLKSFLGKKTLFAFDFDGTIAPIHAHPKHAQLSRTSRKLLKDLSKIAAVAIITGRSRKEIRQKINLPGLIYIGNHGIEGVGDRKTLQKAAVLCRKWQKDLLSSGLPENTYLEQKKYSISVHYRQCRNTGEAGKIILKQIQKLKPKPEVVDGKYTFNLLISNSPHKGTALLSVLRNKKFKNSVYFGDDITDENVFRMKHKKIFSVHIGKKKTSASYFVSSQKQMDKILKRLTALYSEI